MNTLKESTAKTQQSGHAVLIAVLVLTIAAGAFFSWQYVQSKNNKGQPKQPALQQQKKTAEKVVPSDPSEEGKYLVIKEWGVRLLLPQGLKGDAYYSLRNFEENYGHAEGADINAKSFSPECRAVAGDLGLLIVRTTTMLDETAPYIYKRNILHTGDYWYSAAFGKDGCSKALASTKAELFDELYRSVESLESLN